MVQHKSLRGELDDLRAQLEALRNSRGAATAAQSAEASARPATLEPYMAELSRLTQSMLDNAEEMIAEHPAAAVAGALALGIVIGRLTAR